jgi:hypothetical protein
MWRLRGERREWFGRCATCHRTLNYQLASVQPGHALGASPRASSGGKRLDAEHGTGGPPHAALILFNAITHILQLPEDDRGSMSRVGSPGGGGIGLAPIHGARPRGTVMRDGLGEEARGGLPIPLLWAEAIKGLPGLIDGPIRGAPPAAP